MSDAKPVFISYASADREVAERACGALEAAGVSCWIAPRDMPAGASYAEALIEALTRARAVVVVFSAAANDSPHVLRELERAVSRKAPIVALRVAEAAPRGAMEYLISSTHWLDALPAPQAHHFARLAQAVRGLLSPEGAGGDALPAEISLGLAVRALSELGDAAAAISRGGLEGHLRRHPAQHTQRALRGASTETTEVTLAGRAAPVYLYDERVSQAPSDEIYRANVLLILQQAQRQRGAELWAFPTGKARGFPRLRALQATLRAYEDYLESPWVADRPTITALRFALDTADPYEGAALRNAIMSCVSAGSGLLAQRYAVRERQEAQGFSCALARR